MGAYRYNEVDFNDKVFEFQLTFDLNQKHINYIRSLSENHYYYWNDNLRKIADDIKHSHIGEHNAIVEYSKTLTNTQWGAFMLFIDHFLFEGDLWCDLFDAATEEQKDEFFKVS
jgi:hypothetical protein